MAMTFNIFTGTIDYTGASAPPASVEVVEYRTISVGEASAKQLTLAASPATAAKVKVDVKYVGFDIPTDFVVGYGLDFDEKYRNLDFIGVLAKHVYS